MRLRGTLRGPGWRGALLPVALILVAQAAASLTGLDSDSLASPVAIARALAADLSDGAIPAATAETLKAAGAGWLIGAGLGALLGTVLGLVRVLDDALDLTVELIRPVPAVALIPVVMLLLGFGPQMEIAIVAFAMVWPTLVLARAAVRGVEPRLLDVSKVFGLSFPARLAKVVLPSILPRLFVAFRLAAGYALIVAVTVEITANPLGLGHAIMTAQQSLRPASMFAYLIWIGLVGWALNGLLVWLERTAFPAYSRGVRP